MPPLEEWETWPFDGSVEPRTLEPPVAAEQPRRVGCRRCERGLDGVLWSNDNWLVSALAAPSGLPVVVILETREHLDFPQLSDTLAAELGPIMLKVQRSPRSGTTSCRRFRATSGRRTSKSCAPN